MEVVHLPVQVLKICAPKFSNKSLLEFDLILFDLKKKSFQQTLSHQNPSVRFTYPIVFSAHPSRPAIHFECQQYDLSIFDVIFHEVMYFSTYLVQRDRNYTVCLKKVGLNFNN